MTTEPEHTSLESLVEHTYQTWLWLDERVQAFPKAVRPQLGRRALDTVLDALTSLSHAMYPSLLVPQAAQSNSPS
jgi:hypothetical protein